MPLVTLLLLSVTCLVAIAAPWFAYYGVLLLFSFEHLFRTTGDIFPVPIRFTQAATLLLFAHIGLRYVIRKRLPLLSFTGTLFALYLALNIFSVFYTVSVPFTLRQSAVLVVAGLTAFTFAHWRVHVDQANLAIRLILTGALIHMLWSLIQLGLYMALGWEIGFYAEGMGEHLKVRTFGWMFEPNWLGAFIVVVFPWFLFAFDFPETIGVSAKRMRIALGVVLLVFLLNMSRSAWVAAAFQAFFWSMTTTSHLKRYVRLGLALLIPVTAAAVVGWFMIPDDLQAAMLERVFDLEKIGKSGGSANQRIGNYRRLWGFFVDRPFFGYGTGAWPALVGLKVPNAIPTTTYMYVLVEVGLLGFGVLILALWAYLRRLAVIGRSLPYPLGMYMRAAWLSVTGLLLMGLFLEVKTLFSYFPVFGFYLALASALVREKDFRDSVSVS